MMTEKWKEVVEIDDEEMEKRMKRLRQKVENTRASKEQETDKNKTPYDKRVRKKQIINK